MYRNLYYLNDAIQIDYRVLIFISKGYPLVQGRLYTRYAPVRRSSADCKQSLLPLDLHVLSLPLAFILSQDQTLHRIILNIIVLRISLPQKNSQVFLLSLVSLSINYLSVTNLRCQFQYLNELLILFTRLFQLVFLNHSFF